MHIDPGRIGFDIDGVVADTMEAFIRLADRDHAIKVRPEDITDFEVEKCLDMDPAIVEDIFGRLMHDPLGEDLRPAPQSLPVLRDLAKRAPLTFITARPEAPPIAAWLGKHLGEAIFARARLIATGDHDGKVSHVKSLGLSHFVDDRPQTCRLLADETGITPIVFSQPWNRGRHSFATVESWLEIRQLCLVS